MNFSITGEAITEKVRDMWMSDMPKSAFNVCNSMGMDKTYFLLMVIGTHKLEGDTREHPDLQFVEDDAEEKYNVKIGIDVSVQAVKQRLERRYRDDFAFLSSIKRNLKHDLYEDDDDKEYYESQIPAREESLKKNGEQLKFLYDVILEEDYQNFILSLSDDTFISETESKYLAERREFEDDDEDEEFDDKISRVEKEVIDVVQEGVLNKINKTERDEAIAAADEILGINEKRAEEKAKVEALMDDDYCDRAVEIFCQENNFSHYGVTMGMGVFRVFCKNHYDEILEIVNRLKKESEETEEEEKQFMLEHYNNTVIKTNERIATFHTSVKDVQVMDNNQAEEWKDIELTIRNLSLLRDNLRDKNIKGKKETLNGLIPRFVDPETEENINHCYILPDGKLFPCELQEHIYLEDQLNDTGLYGVIKTGWNFIDKSWIKISSRELQCGFLNPESFELQKDVLTRFLLTRDWESFRFYAGESHSDPMKIIEELGKKCDRKKS
jgi:hypothetical protein